VVGLFVNKLTPVKLIILIETTKGVYQASGYGDIASDKSIWSVLHLIISLCLFVFSAFHRFWFFAARKNPQNAPLITWFNGGVSDTVR
jgi:hypothetical protein